MEVEVRMMRGLCCLWSRRDLFIVSMVTPTKLCFSQTLVLKARENRTLDFVINEVLEVG